MAVDFKYIEVGDKVYIKSYDFHEKNIIRDAIVTKVTKTQITTKLGRFMRSTGFMYGNDNCWLVDMRYDEVITYNEWAKEQNAKRDLHGKVYHILYTISWKRFSVDALERVYEILKEDVKNER